jgi:transcriptional regulator with XRE-family HTH domain
MGHILKAIRLKKNRRLTDLTRDLKIDTSGLSRVERGLQGFPQDTLVGLLEYYGINLPALLIAAGGLTESDLEGARKRSKPQPEDLEISVPEPVLADDGWIEHNPVLSSRVFAGHGMLLCRRSFENPEFELIYLGRVMRELPTIQAGKAAAAGFARKVLREECALITA